MKIAILTPLSLPNVGGIEMMVDAIARQLLREGHQVRLFTPTSPSNENFPFPVAQIKGLPPFYPIPPQNMPILERGLEEFLEKEYNKNSFDLLHAQMTYPTGFCALDWGKKKKVPVVITSHGMDIIGRPEDNYGFLLNKQLAKKISQCLRQAPALTIVSPHLRKHLLALGASEGAIHTIPNGVFLDNFHNTGKPSGSPYILAMGSLHWIKGFDLLLDAFARARAIIEEMTLVIAGVGPDRALLVNKSLRMNLTGKVRFLSFLRGEEKIRCFSGCRFLVCPSRYESFGMVALEAMAAGKPVLAFDVGGVSELIRHGENGLLVPPGDVEELASGMLKLWGKEVHFSKIRLIEAARAYDWKTVTGKYISLYQSIL
jgi:glycosyltransferase involved in cell wall biosynthesis